MKNTRQKVTGPVAKQPPGPVLKTIFVGPNWLHALPEERVRSSLQRLKNWPLGRFIFLLPSRLSETPRKKKLIRFRECNFTFHVLCTWGSQVAK